MKVENDERLLPRAGQGAARTLQDERVDGLVLIGGDTTDRAMLENGPPSQLWHRRKTSARHQVRIIATAVKP